MSKQREPQVGDVWEYQNLKYHIVEKGTYEDFFDGLVDGVKVINEQLLKREGLKTKYLVKDGKYLGKSKASIDDLFKTENEE